MATVKMVKPDAMIAAAAHVEREYGSTGYLIGTEEGLNSGGGIFLVSHSDGSEFRLIADRYGNVDLLPHDWTERNGEQQVATIRMLREDREARMAAKHEEFMAAQS